MLPLLFTDLEDKTTKAIDIEILLLGLGLYDRDGIVNDCVIIYSVYSLCTL